MEAVYPHQIKKIYAIGNALGIVVRGSHDDDLHALISAVSSRDSAKSLTAAEAEAVIRELEGRQGGAPRPATALVWQERVEVPGGATEGQQRKVWALMYALAAKDETPSTATLGDRLCGILHRELKVDSTPENPFIWVDGPACNKLIEVLKGYVKNAVRKSGEH